MKNIAIFASGNGSNFEAISRAVLRGDININIALLICDKPGVNVICRANALGIPTAIYDPKNYSNRDDYETQILATLCDYEIDFIVLAGYMRIVGKKLLSVFEGRIINIHPSVLPEFPGLNAIKKAFDAGVKQTGVTIHYIDSGIDTGPIIAQETISVLPDDTLKKLEARVHDVEHRLYISVLQCMFKER